MSDAILDSYFRDGGTLPADTPSYVRRPADDELLEAVLNREYCYILTPRQMGKSSLMTSTSQRLKQQNVQTAIVDIQGIGTSDVEKFYNSLFSRIRRGLRLKVDLEEWMKKKSNLGFGQVLSDFIQDVVLVEVSDSVVIFLDEVDWMIKIDFRDEFFASIRSMYNARAEYPEFNRISFVLLGVASPADLISEPTRTPFNIGHAIPLQELSLLDAAPLQNGLEQLAPGEGTRILGRIFYWTNGHPYLTQKVCKSIVETGKTTWTDNDVDDLVNRLFLAEESRKEANLKFIQDRILSNEQLTQLLKVYQRVRKGKVKENGQSILHNQLMLSGLLTSRDGHLEIRNRIYDSVFNERWIKRNMPKNWQRTALVSLGVVTFLLLSVFVYDFTVGMSLNTHTADFAKANTPAERLMQLARIYQMRSGVLSNTKVNIEATDLFYDLTADEQTSLFTDYTITGNPDLHDDLLVVVQRLYVTVAYVDPRNDNSELLRAMSKGLSAIRNNDEAAALQSEIDSWRLARLDYIAGNFDAAITKYTETIGDTPHNPAVTYERALVYISQGEYESALADLDTTISLAKESTQGSEVDLTPIVTDTVIPSPTDTKSPIETQSPSQTQSLSQTQSPKPTESTFETRQPTASPPALSTTSTFTPAPATATRAATSTPPPSPTVTFTPTQTFTRYESNFSTFSEVYRAVRKLFDENNSLAVSFSNSTTNYSNLGTAGFKDLYTAVAPLPTQKILSTNVTVTTTPIANTTSVLDAAFSPDGTMLAIGTIDGRVILFSLGTDGYQEMAQLRGHTSSVNHVAFSPDGKVLASSSTDNTIRLWDVTSLQMIGQPLSGHADTINDIAFSPKGDILGSVSIDGTFVLWDLTTQTRILGLQGKSGGTLVNVSFKLGPPLEGSDPTPNPPSSGLTTIAFNSSATIIAVGDIDGRVSLWNISAPGTPVFTADLIAANDVTSAVSGLAFSTEDENLAYVTADGLVALYNVNTGTLTNSFLVEAKIGSVTFSPDGQRLGIGDLDGVVTVIDLSTEKSVVLSKDSDSGVRSIKFDATGNLLAVAKENGIVILLGINGQEEGRITIDAAQPSSDASSDLAWGIDVNVFQQNNNIDWNTLKESGMDFVFIRASSGANYIDPSFQTHWDAAGQVALVRGAYHYFIASDNPRQQADRFLSVVRFESELPLVVVVDTQLNEAVDAGSYLNNLRSLLDRLESETGRKPILNTRSSFIEERIALMQDLGLTSYRLWLAQYPFGFDRVTMPNENIPAMPDGWQNDWAFWQYTDSGILSGVTDANGAPAKLDVNFFHGTDAQFQQYLSSGVLQPASTQAATNQAIFTYTEENHCHVLPDASSAAFATWPAGTAAFIVGQSPNAPGWWQIAVTVDSAQGTCWAVDAVGTASGDLSQVPAVDVSSSSATLSLSCTSPEYLVKLLTGDEVVFPCLNGGTARITRIDNIILPSDIPAGYEYVSAVNIDLFQNDVPIQVIPDGGEIKISFPARSPQSNSILYWDQGASLWRVLSEYQQDQSGASVIFPLDLTDPKDERKILSGVRAITNEIQVKVEASTNFTGVFVLATSSK